MLLASGFSKYRNRNTFDYETGALDYPRENYFRDLIGARMSSGFIFVFVIRAPKKSSQVMNVDDVLMCFVRL